MEDGWMIHRSKKVFWFPVGDKVRFSPVIEDTLIVGYESGQVDFLEFKESPWGLEIMHVILLAGKIWKAQVAFIFHTYKQSLGLDITVTTSKELGLPKLSIL